MTTACNVRERDVLRLIRDHLGPYQSVSAQEIGAAFHADPRWVRSIVLHLRQDHNEPICSTPRDGYFWPRNAQDAGSTFAQLESRIIETEKTKIGIKAGLRQLFGEPELFDPPREEATPEEPKPTPAPAPRFRPVCRQDEAQEVMAAAKQLPPSNPVGSYLAELARKWDPNLPPEEREPGQEG